MRYILDTNVIVRFYVGDVETQKAETIAWFKDAEKGKRKLFVSPVVVAECVFVLQSFYKLPKQDIADFFENFLSQKWLVVEQREALRILWKYFLQGFHFVDSFLLASSNIYGTKVLTFDKEINKNQK